MLPVTLGKQGCRNRLNRIGSVMFIDEKRGKGQMIKSVKKNKNKKTGKQMRRAEANPISKKRVQVTRGKTHWKILVTKAHIEHILTNKEGNTQNTLNFAGVSYLC